MSLEKIKVQTCTPTTPLRSGRGYYQLEEDVLFVQLGQFSFRNRYFSFLESRKVRFDINKRGQLIFIELNVPRRQWKTNENFSFPITFKETDLRFTDFREYIKEPLITTNQDKSSIRISFETEYSSDFAYLLSENVICQVTKDQILSSIFITDIQDDFAGRELGKFRKKLTASAGETVMAGQISPIINYPPH